MPNPDIDPNAGAAQGGEGGQEPDYKALYEQLKAESRKWEDRSKQNKAKADKLDELMAGNDSIEERIAALEARLPSPAVALVCGIGGITHAAYEVLRCKL